MMTPTRHSSSGRRLRLIGGRLDYLDGKPVAALVYRRRIHVINLFVSQDTATIASASPRETFQGFNIPRWNDQGLSLLAISDLNQEELKEFRARFREAAAARVQ
jgi:anti-sigma factor RsiW